ESHTSDPNNSCRLCFDWPCPRRAVVALDCCRELFCYLRPIGADARPLAARTKTSATAKTGVTGLCSAPARGGPDSPRSQGRHHRSGSGGRWWLGLRQRDDLKRDGYDGGNHAIAGRHNPGIDDELHCPALSSKDAWTSSINHWNWTGDVIAALWFCHM